MRHRLKRWEIKDTTALMELMNNVHIWSTLTDSTELPFTKEDASEYINRAIEHESSFDAFAIEQDGNVIGGVSLTKLDPPYHIIFELNFWLYPGNWQQGIMTDVLYNIIQHGFMHLPAMKLTAKVFANDTKTINLLNKVGFKQIALLESYALKCGKLLDLVVFEKTEIGG